jgi:uncharacterized protein (TIGR00369 family)
VETLHDHLLGIPHARAIGMSLVSYDETGCVVRVPYAEHLVGDPDTGVVHGGVLTALLDNTCGMAVRSPGSETGISIATLDLRIDYLAAAEPHRDILAHAVCYKRTRNIAFVRANAYQSTPDDPIATCVASFMLGTPNTPRGGDGRSDFPIAMPSENRDPAIAPAGEKP